MNTKIKILISWFMILLSYSSTHARWYNTYRMPINRGVNHCRPDTLTDAVGPRPSDAWFPGTYGVQYPNWQTRTISTGWCQQWDSTPPTVTSVISTDGWTNNTTININWSAYDRGWSWLKSYTIYVYRWGSQESPTTHVDTVSVASGNNATYIGQDGYAYRFAVCAIDIAWNTSPWSQCKSGNNIARIDTQPPTIGQLNTTTDTNLLATDKQNFVFTYNDGGAPVRITSDVTNVNDPNTLSPRFNPSPYGYDIIDKNVDIRDVDKNRWTNGGRAYSYRITKLCDEAGNTCWTGNKVFKFYVYANPDASSPSNTISDPVGDGVADGQENTYIRTLKDAYGNAIVPASGISRTINMRLEDISNSMFLDQYNRIGQTSVFVDNRNTPLQISGIQNLWERTSSDWQYPLPVFVYTPTASAYTTTVHGPVSDPNADFAFNIHLTVNDNVLWSPAWFPKQIMPPKYIPLYSSVISGDLRLGWFIEWAEQLNPISILNKSPSINPSSLNFQLAFSGTNASNFTMHTVPGGEISSNPTTIQSNTDNIPNFSTRLVQKANVIVDDFSNLQLSSHFNYRLDGKQVIYNSDIIGRKSYFGPAVKIGAQVWIKIIWPVASNAIRKLTTWQFDEAISIFSGISRSQTRNRIRKSINLATRNMVLRSMDKTIQYLWAVSPGSATKGSVLRKWSDSSIMIVKGSDTINLSLINGISGKRTLVIRGANLYIDKDMYYANDSSILAVVVEKDSQWNGGNLLVNSEVTNIVGTYVLDGSILTSTDGSNPTWFLKIAQLKNQLHIYGSIISENTIWWSRMNPRKCPPLISESCSSLAVAQKYDMNYLRRYYLIDPKVIEGEDSSGVTIPFGGAKIIGGATCDMNGACTGFKTWLIKKFVSTWDKLAKYPVIIEYNPLIRIDPPIWFDSIMD